LGLTKGDKKMAKKKEAKNLVGKVIVMNELQKKFLDNFIEKRLAAEVAFEIASENIRRARNGLWDAIFDFYLELEGYHSNYNGKTGEVTVIGKKRDKKEV
jgi:hypothetical protein